MKIRWYHFFSIIYPLQLTGLLYLLILRRFLPTPPAWEWFLFTLLTALLLVLTLKRHYDPEHSTTAPMLRYLIFWFGLIYLYHKFFREEFLQPDFSRFPGELILLLTGSLFSWMIASSTLESFLFRDHFHHLLLRKGKSRIKEKIRNLGYYLNVTVLVQKRLLRRQWLTLWIPALLIWFIPLTGGTLRFDESLFMLVQVLLLLYWRLKLSQSLEEDLLLGEDVVLKSEARRGEGKYFFLLMAFLFPLSLFLAGSRALFSGQWILRFFKWLASLFTADPRTTEEALEKIETFTTGNTSAGSPLDLGLPVPSEPFRLPEEWKKALLILAGVLAGAVVLIYLFYPLIKNWKTITGDYGTKEPWFRRLRIWFQELLDQIRDNKRKHRELGIEWKNQDKVEFSQGSIHRENHEEKKVKQIMIRLFLKLCRWGERRGVPYHRGMGPEAYCQILAETFPEKREEFTEKGLMFRKIFYSRKGPDREESGKLQTWLKEIKRWKPGKETGKQKGVSND